MRKKVLTIAKVELAVILIFAIMKFSRSTVISATYNKLIHTLFYSFPNLAEGIVGVLTTSLILIVLSRRFSKVQLNGIFIYFLSFVLAGIYVISQEFKLHNIGGNNVYDPMDVIFSVIGLTTGLMILFIIKPNVPQDQ